MNGAIYRSFSLEEDNEMYFRIAESYDKTLCKRKNQIYFSRVYLHMRYRTWMRDKKWGEVMQQCHHISYNTYGYFCNIALGVRKYKPTQEELCNAQCCGYVASRRRARDGNGS